MRVRRLAGVACLAAVLAPGPASGHAAVAACDGRAATIVGTDRDDELTGTPGDDVIAGLGGQDTIDGGGGNDVVCGDAGADVVIGGAGSDRLFGGDNGLVPRFESRPRAARRHPGARTGRRPRRPRHQHRRRGAATTAADTLDLTDVGRGRHVDLVAGTAVGEGTDIVVVPAPARSGVRRVEVLGSRARRPDRSAPRATTTSSATAAGTGSRGAVGTTSS